MSYVVQQKPTEHCKAMILQLKINKNLKPIHYSGKKETFKCACQKKKERNKIISHESKRRTFCSYLSKEMNSFLPLK